MAPPLAGVRVVDMSRVMAGPFAAVQLADLGAEVIKIEVTPHGDILRYWPGQRRGGVSAMFCALNRGKRSVSVDLVTTEGRQAVRDLAAIADVFIENYRPGVCGGMGLGPADLLGANPELIYLSINGFGSTSPAANEPAYDTIIQARSGLAARQGDGVGAPAVTKSYIVDKLTGIFAAQAVLAALVARAQGAGGQHVEVPMMDSAVYYLWPDVLCDQSLIGEGVGDGPLPASLLKLTPTADGHIAFLAISPKERAGLDRATGQGDAERCFATTPADEALARLRAEGVPCAAVVDPSDVPSDPHLVATGALVEWDHPTAGRLRQARHPARFSATPAEFRPYVPALGADNETLLITPGGD